MQGSDLRPRRRPRHGKCRVSWGPKDRRRRSRCLSATWAASSGSPVRPPLRPSTRFVPLPSRRARGGSATAAFHPPFLSVVPLRCPPLPAPPSSSPPRPPPAACLPCVCSSSSARLLVLLLLLLLLVRRRSVRSLGMTSSERPPPVTCETPVVVRGTPAVVRPRGAHARREGLGGDGTAAGRPAQGGDAARSEVRMAVVGTRCARGAARKAKTGRSIYRRRIQRRAIWSLQPRKGMCASWSMEYPAFCGARRSSELSLFSVNTVPCTANWLAGRQTALRGCVCMDVGYEHGIGPITCLALKLDLSIHA